MKSIIFSSIIILLTAAMFTGCVKERPDEKAAISVQDRGSLTQSAFADETQAAGGVTFTSAGAWTSSIATATLKSAALDASKVKTGFAPYFAASGLTLNGKTYKTPAPAAYFGAMGQK